MKPRIAIVEDEKPQAEAIKRVLRGLSNEQKKEAGIDDFDFGLAHCGADARQLLNQASHDHKPYDMMFLDLSLPENPGERDKPELGLEILKLARETESAKDVVVVSAFSDLERYARIGANDFIAKPYDKEELLFRMLKVWDGAKEKTRRQMFSDMRRWLDETIKPSFIELAPYSEKGLNDQLGSCFSQLIQSVRRETRDLRMELLAHLDLSPTDRLPDTLEQRLAAVEKAISKSRNQWLQIQEPFKIKGDTPCILIVEEIVTRLAKQFRPYLMVRPDVPESQQTKILSFDDSYGKNDSIMVIKEILTGGLSEMKENEWEKRWQVLVSIHSDGGMAEIQFRDNYTPLPKDLAKKVSEGDNVPPRDGLGKPQWRAWGLSVVQHIATRGGGRLIVQPSEDGNLITYRVTLAQDV